MSKKSKSGQPKVSIPEVVTVLRLLESLCLDVACLDDAGLPLEHKAAIQKAREIRKRLDDEREAGPVKTKVVKGITYYRAAINGRPTWVTIPEDER
jgi:hypothetical protein